MLHTIPAFSEDMYNYCLKNELMSEMTKSQLKYRDIEKEVDP